MVKIYWNFRGLLSEITSLKWRQDYIFQWAVCWVTLGAHRFPKVVDIGMVALREEEGDDRKTGWWWNAVWYEHLGETFIFPYQTFLTGKKFLLIFPRGSCITLNTFGFFPYLYLLERFYQWLGLQCFQNKIQVQLWLSYSLAMPVSWLTKRQWAFLCFLPQDGEHTWIRTCLRTLSKGSLETYPSL